MKKRIFIGVALLGVLAIVALFTLAGTRKHPDAVYQGKTAQQWLDLVFSSQQSEAIDAFKKMGPNALPTLMDAFRQADEETSWDKIYGWFYRNVPAAVQLRLAMPQTRERRLMRGRSAEFLLINNREISGTALHELAQMAVSKTCPCRAKALRMLVILVGPNDTEYLPVLIGAFDEIDLVRRTAVCLALARLGPAAKAAVPELTAANRDQDLDTRVMAAYALWKVDGETNVALATFKEAAQPVTWSTKKNMALIYLHQINPNDASLIPLMVDRLNSPVQDGKLEIVAALGTYGPAAAAAVPALKQLVKSRDQEMYWQALSALRRIDPDEAKKFKSE